MLVSALLLLSGAVQYASIYAGFIPARFTSGLPFLDQSELLPALLTPFGATLIHANLVHLGFNMVMLLFTGMAAERALGVRGIVLLYVVGAVAAVAAHGLLDPLSGVPMIGASGAVSAIVGAYSLLYGRNRARAIGPFSAETVQVLWLVVAWTAINMLVGWMTSGTGTPVAAAAHIGGFVAGVALTKPLLRWQWRDA